MNKFRLILSTITATVVAACTVQEDTTLCYFPNPDSDEFQIIDVASADLAEHILEHGDLCYSAEDDACYAPDIDGWEDGGEFCLS